MERSRVYENYMRVGNLLFQLEDLYHQVKESCRDIDKYLTSGSRLSRHRLRQATFTEELQLIGIFLKVIGGEELTAAEERLSDRGDLIYDMQWVQISRYIEDRIEWLQNILSKCRRTQSGVRQIQQRFLERRYAPGGPMYQQAQQRFSDRSSLTQ